MFCADSGDAARPAAVSAGAADALARELRDAQLDRRAGTNDRVPIDDDVLPDVPVDGIADAEFVAVRRDSLVERTEYDGALRHDQLLGVSERRCGDEGT